jgi:hypothetical protein
MKRCLLIGIFIVCHLVIYGQSLKDEVKVTFGKVEKRSSEDDFYKVNIIGSDNNGIYVIGTPYYQYYKGQSVIIKKEPYRILRYSHDLNSFKSQAIDLQYDKAELNYEFAFYINQKIYLFSSFQNHDHKKTYLFVQTIDKNTLKPNSQYKKIAEIDYANESKYKQASFNFSLSPNQKKVLIYYSLLNKHNGILGNGFEVLGDNMETIWSLKNIPTPATSGVFSFKEYKVDNQGEVFILGRTYKDNKEFAYSKYFEKNWFLSNTRTLLEDPVYATYLLHFGKSKGLIRQIPLVIEGKRLKDVAITFKNNQEILGTGFYSSKDKISVSGVFTFTLKKDGKAIENIHKKDFDKEFITQGMDDKEKQKTLAKLEKGKEYEKYIYLLSEVKSLSSGGQVFIAEQLRQEKKRKRVGNEVYTQNVFHHHAILAIDIAPNGSINWMKKIPKQQYSREESILNSSFGLFEKKDKLYFIYNDIAKRNIGISDRVKNSKAMMAELDRKGNYRVAELFSKDDSGINLRPLDFHQVNGNEVVFYGNTSFVSGYVKFSFK